MAERYCTNCGTQLADDAQFCPSCGRPVHETAAVSTPEADVGVPPPPGPQAGSPSYAPTTAAPQGRSTFSRLLIGCVGLFVLGFLFVGCLAVLSGGGGGGGGGDNVGAGDAGNNGGQAEQEQAVAEQEEPKEQPQKKPKPERKYRVGQTATVANVQWKVTDAFLTEQLKSTFGTQKRGRFVVVDFTFTNNRNEEVTLDPELHMILKDSQGREFGSDVDAWEFVPTDLMIFLEPVNPGVSTEGRVVYEVAPDAKGFTLQLDDVEMMEDKSAVYDLSNIRMRTYDPASASASPGAY